MVSKSMFTFKLFTVIAITSVGCKIIAAELPELVDGIESRVLRHTGDVISAAFSPDGKRIVTASWDQTARIWNANTGELIHTLAGHTAWVGSAAFSPDGNRIVTASADGTARIWHDTRVAKSMHVLALARHDRLGHDSPVNLLQGQTEVLQLVAQHLQADSFGPVGL